MIMTATTRPPNIARRGRYTELPNPPKKIDMQQREHITPADAILKKRYEDDPSTLVSGEGYLRYAAGDRRGYAVPDFVIAFGVEAAEIIRAKGYAIAEVGKPPDFVMEIASATTGVRDFTVKRRIYERLRAGEYWRFDETGGRYHDAPLAGDILLDGEYRPMDIRSDPDGTFWGYSPALHLWLVWQDGNLRFYDPETSEFLRDLSEEARRSEAERAGRIVAERGRDSERAGRIAAERRESAEREARIESDRRRAESERRESAEREARIVAERRQVESERRESAERAARIEAERGRDAEREARIEMESELERLRRLLENPE